MEIHHVHACRLTLALLQIVDQNVQSTLNVEVIKPVYLRNAKTLALDYVALGLGVAYSIISLHVLVQKTTQVIHSRIVIRNHLHVSFCNRNSLES